MKIVFFGTPGFATPFLKALHDDPSVKVVAVVCQPDKPKGRGNKLSPPETKMLADRLGLPVLQPKTLKSENVQSELEALNADMFVVVAYGKIIPQDILDIPQEGAINVHPSLLPKYRGPSPMQWAIANGDMQTGVTIMLLDAGMDTGPILRQETIDLDSQDTYLTLSDKVHKVGPRLLIETMTDFASGNIQPQTQDDTQASITHLLKREDGHIDWSQSAKDVDQLVRAYDPWPGTWSIWDKNGDTLRLKIVKAQPIEEDKAVPGKVTLTNDSLTISCNDRQLNILELQLEGKPKMKTKDFIRGYSQIDGVVLT